MAEIFLTSLTYGALFIFIYMTLWYIVAAVAKRNDLIDIAWGLGFILLTMLILVSYENAGFRPILASFLVFVWGLRLSLYVFLKNSGREEDPRYRRKREEWGKYFFIRSYLEIFLSRGVFTVLVATPVIYINTFGGGGLVFLDYLGAGLWLFGFSFEAISDWQFSKFLKTPENKGKIMKSGLWALSRHPNYFGEVAGWWGIFLLALSVPYGYLTVIGPLTITLIILIGASAQEKDREGNPEFEEYKKSANAFLPWPRKRA